MPWRDRLRPVPMQRVALVAPVATLRAVLLQVAGSGSVELDPASADEETAGQAARRLQGAPPGAASPGGDAGAAPPALSPSGPDLEGWERAGRWDLIAGEAELNGRMRDAVAGGRAAALAGWTPADAVPGLAARLAETGGAVVPLPRPRGVDPPTLLRASGVRRSLTPLLETYGTMPYADVDPTVLAAVAYVLMFGMMFGDVGHGLLLLLLAAGLRAGRPRRLARFGRAWPFVGGAGLASAVFGLLYGECFGPTGLVPVLWLAPLEEPVPLLLAAVGVGGLLLAGAYALGTVNRWREGGWPLALYAPSGIAGAAVFLGLGLAAGGWLTGLAWPVAVGGVVAVGGLALAFTGFLFAAGGGWAGVGQAAVEVFDLVARLGANVVSFARLAAFGLTHAAIGAVVWQASAGLWGQGVIAGAAAVAVFTVGNALAFSLEALVAAVQALRLEYYELFSRVFQAQGRPFRPWHVPIASEDEVLCRSG
ncbi:MAG TPA: V-type ATPase 116kDa subunit family protein [Streptosporangiaceae bacterium]|jgi:V/A-type H+-transporting ATPase subunit I|nr:V-type ATPase 116kDa subunit family protein [Actinomycetota bacterium]